MKTRPRHRPGARPPADRTADSGSGSGAIGGAEAEAKDKAIGAGAAAGDAGVTGDDAAPRDLAVASSAAVTLAHAPGSPAAPAPPPLSLLLQHTARAVQAVRVGRSLDAALAACPASARRGTQALCFHVMRWLGGALAARARLAPRTPPPLQEALLLSALALLWPGAPAPYAAHTLVDQAVAAGRALAAAGAAAASAERAGAFVNAVLRRFLRERDRLAEALCAADPVARHQHPAWWIERIAHDWPACWQALLQADQQHPPMTLRVNARRDDVPGYLRRLDAAGIDARAVPGAPHGVMLDTACPVERLPGFADGDVSVQDAAAQRAAPLLLAGAGRLASGARVLDACAAPGGKTAHLLELADLDLLALDSDAARLARVDAGLQRLRLQARTRCADAAEPATWWDGRPFEAILLDAPCSGSGVLRRHPDARWLRRASDVDRLAAAQGRLLDALWPTLAPSGRLLYATCSVFKAEGEQVIDAFLQRARPAGAALAVASPGHLLPLPDNHRASGQPAAAADGCLADGFYYALLVHS